MIFMLFRGKSEEKRGKFMKCFMGKEEKLELRQKKTRIKTEDIHDGRKV